MPIPQVDVDEVSQRNFGVYTVILAARQEVGDATFAFFLDQVPERGTALWERFRLFQREHSGTDFFDFIKSVVTADPLKLFYPKECILDSGTRGLLASEVQEALRGVGVRTNDDVLKVYFAEGAPYSAVRSVACKGCPMTKCQHWLNSHGRGGRR